MTENKVDQRIVENKYRYILIAGARANQLLLGAHPKVSIDAKKKTFIALEEIRQGKVVVTFPGAEENPVELK
ncbi:MAG: DNA-directed RNA polymerase subunit omega [Acidobacteria bacterium]|nr:MAG: DNA-directed RNA polymerase subunit omega [Acidobacteriota bacterium]RLE24070.1 MAG: DNA-directed RNA polymerase subunit omega [Acidobacteriota bacterium]